LQVTANNPGDSFTVQVLNENNLLDSTINDGGLFAVGSSSATAANSLTISATSTARGNMAFAAYGSK
jgi:hypothetical protein